MSMYDEAKEAERKVMKADGHLDKDANSHLRENINGLGRAVKDMSYDQAQVANSYLREITADLKVSGREALSKAEDRIREQPAQSIALAFAGGILASILFRRRHA